MSEPKAPQAAAGTSTVECESDQEVLDGEEDEEDEWMDVDNYLDILECRIIHLSEVVENLTKAMDAWLIKASKHV